MTNDKSTSIYSLKYYAYRTFYQPALTPRSPTSYPLLLSATSTTTASLEPRPESKHAYVELVLSSLTFSGNQSLSVDIEKRTGEI